MVSLGGVGHGEMSEGFFGLTIAVHFFIILFMGVDV